LIFNMHSYRQALAIFGLSFITASSLSVPRLLTGELPSIAPVPLGANTELARITEGTIEAGESANYPRSHTYDSRYEFSSQDGWEAVPVTDLSYKYDNVTSTHADPAPHKRQRSGVKRSVGDILGGTVSHALGETWNSVKGTGKAQGVTITW
jgi:hypothetical protein